MSGAPLLDTHAWVWWIDRDRRLGKATIERLDTLPADGRPYLCDISLWEVAMLVERGRLAFTVPLADWLDAAAHARSVRILPITPAIAAENGGLARDLPPRSGRSRDRRRVSSHAGSAPDQRPIDHAIAARVALGAHGSRDLKRTETGATVCVMPAARMLLKLGARLGPYATQAAIGAGGMSACGDAALAAMRSRQRRISVSSRRGRGPGAVKRCWPRAHPGPILPEELQGTTLTLEGRELQLFGGVQGDGSNNSFVWIPSIRTVVAGTLSSAAFISACPQATTARHG